jgi:hypothetical protein
MDDWKRLILKGVIPYEVFFDHTDATSSRYRFPAKD